MKRLCQIKDTLISLVEQQMADPQKVDTKEMGEVIDMIKDLTEACYYKAIIDAMYEVKEEAYTIGNNRKYKARYVDSDLGYNGSTYTGIGSMHEDNKKMGLSPMKRKSYIESKERHMDQALQIRELEEYVQELTSDLMEMIQDATPEEKQLLQRRIATLATKIV